ncbi:MAG TPA: hypothetical protein VJ902_02920, partial [Wenzhouxiangellaceae bacterium]|nr:hypothetical protein [Wenzhouxiangellaceae bacterium]
MSDSQNNPFLTRFISGLGLAGIFCLAGAVSTAQAQWPLPLGSLGEDEVVAVKASPSGDVFVTGHFSGAIETEVGTVTSQGLQDIFIARVSQAGQLIWLRSAGGQFQDQVNGLTLDDGNNVYIVGTFSDSISLGSNSLNSSGLTDGFVGKLDGEGTWGWAKKIAGTGTETADTIITLPGQGGVFPQVPESVAVTGIYECDVAFGNDAQGDPVALSRNPPGAFDDCFPGRSDIYLVRFASNTGAPILAVDRGTEATGFENATQLIRDDQNRVWLAGTQVVGGAQERLNDNFSGGLGAWQPDDASLGVVQNDPAGLLSGSNMLGVRGSRTTVQSPVVSAANSQALIVELDVYRGINYPSETTSSSSSFSFLFPCFLFLLCERQVTTTDYFWQSGANWSARPFGNQNFLIQYLDVTGNWITLREYAGSGTQGQQFAQRGAQSFLIEDEDAMHPGFRLRAFLTGGSGQDFEFDYRCTRTEDFLNGAPLGSSETCATTRVAPDPGAWFPWWHVDDVRIQSVPAGQPFILPVDNILNADTGPTFGDSKDLELGLDITGMAADPSGARVIISGNRAGTPGLDSCDITSPSGSESGTYLAALDRDSLNCLWARTADGGFSEDLVVDQAGNMYVTGLFTGRMDFTLDVGLDSTSPSTSDVFIARYQPGGLLDWATGGGDFNDDEADADFGIPAFAGGTDNDAGLAIATDGVATLYVGGRFRGTASFGPVDTLVALQGSDGFVINLGTDGKFFQEQAWLAGVPLTPPEDAEVDNLALPPEFAVDGEPFDAIGQKIFSWSKAAGQPAKLIPLQPFGTIEVKWRKAGELPASDARVLSLGSIAWPNEPCGDVVVSGCYQVHVIGAPVQAEPASGDYRIIEVISPAAGSSNPTNDSGQFSATRSGTASIVYVNGPQLDPLQYPTVVEVVRTLPYTAVPLFLDGVEAEIGQPITDPFHNEPNRNGFVVNVNAYYDGNGPEAAYNRSSRTGPIIPVNRYSNSRPQDQGRALAVAWYRANSKGVYWPAKAVSYVPRWPFDPDRIVIASQQGSEWQNQQPLDPLLFPSARVYVQNDFNLPGYNPNDEHAFTAPSTTGSGFPAVFALRSDFGDRLENDPAAG